MCCGLHAFTNNVRAMGPGGSYAIATFASGVLLLMGWLFATVGHPRSGAILKKSLVLFVVPMFFWPGRLLLHLPLGIWLAAAAEEGLKAFASTRERNREDKFWLVCLFGIWELTFSKPLWGLVLARSGESWDRLSMLGLIYATALPVLMHAVTAGIYAVTDERKLWAAFTASWIVHVAFNEAVFNFGLSPELALIETTALATLLAPLVFILRREQALDHVQPAIPDDSSTFRGADI